MLTGQCCSYDEAITMQLEPEFNDTDASPGSSTDDAERLRARLHQMAEEQFRRQMRQASILLSSGKAKAAVPLLERCFELRPDDVNVLTNLGGAYILVERHQRAVPLLEKAAELAPYLGKLVTSTHARQENALRAYRRVIEIDASYPSAHYNMGLIFVDRRDWQAAQDAFSRALEVNPHDKDAKHMHNRVTEILNSPPDPRKN
jgi:tetratricopeptide (TPR) repeat protein